MKDDEDEKNDTRWTMLLMWKQHHHQDVEKDAPTRILRRWSPGAGKKEGRRPPHPLGICSDISRLWWLLVSLADDITWCGVLAVIGWDCHLALWVAIEGGEILQPDRRRCGGRLKVWIVGDFYVHLILYACRYMYDNPAVCVCVVCMCMCVCEREK